MNEQLPQFLTLEEVAKRLKVTRRTVYRYQHRKDNPLPVVYFSDRTPRVPWDQFNLWLDSLTEGGEVNDDNT